MQSCKVTWLCRVGCFQLPLLIGDALGTFKYVDSFWRPLFLFITPCSLLSTLSFLTCLVAKVGELLRFATSQRTHELLSNVLKRDYIWDSIQTLYRGY